MGKMRMLAPAHSKTGLLQIAGEFEEFSPFLFKKMNGDVVQLNMIGNFAIWFFGFPGDEVLSLCDGGGLGFVIGHGFLLVIYGYIN